MIAPIFSLLAQCDRVTKLLEADSIVRAWSFGVAPDEPQLPYVTWQNVAGTALNNLDDRPSGDQVVIQFDVYDTDDERLIEIAQAVRYAIELECNVTSIRDVSKDPTTGVFHIGFDVMWILPN